MSEHGTPWPSLGATDAIRTVLARWFGDVRFAARLSSDTGVFLVLDGAATRILHASDRARGLARAVSDTQARLIPAFRIAEQIGPSRLVLDRPTLARVRLDPRGVAIPATCTVVRSALPNGETVLILALSEAARAERSAVPPATGPDRVVAGPVASPADEALAPPRVPSASGGTAPQRFVWRSDAAGVLTQLSGPAGAVLREAMIARSWHGLSESGALVDAGGLLAALTQGRTFRGIPVTLIRGGGAAPVDLDVSGAPLDRGSAGFGGFGIIRSAPGVSAVALPPEPETVVVPDAPFPVASTAPPWEGVHDEAAAWTDDATLDEGPVPPRPGPADPHLSSNEHDAFREIARALGARFAGDAEPMPEEAGPAVSEVVRACAVMPFPLRPAEPGARDHDAAMVATLERLPTGVLVYRGDTILFANGPLLDLAGFDDFASLAAAGGVGRLFRGLAPHERADDAAPAILSTRDGASLGVEIERSAIDWAGAPAELLLARDAAPGEALRQQAATAIAQDFAGRRGTDALGALDVIDDGIAILDANGRILSLNRGAATILDLDPREVVGASFLSLFAAASAVDLLAILHGVPGPVGPVPNMGSAVTVQTRSGGHRLQIRMSPLPGTDEPRLCAVIRDAVATRGIDADTLDPGRLADGRMSEFLAKMDREIRTPIGGILGLADGMLAEPSGPGDAERHRRSLGEIRTAGSQVLALVDDLLELARIEAGRLDLTVTELPLNAIVSRCVALLQPQAARNRIVIRTSFSDDLATLMADEPSVRQATLNVIANALAFTEAGGQVIVSTTMADRGEIALRVRDTGIGMTPDEVETALQPFRQADGGARKGTGLGLPLTKALGLPLTKALVEANHGHFRISSRKNEGTLVEMLFPTDAAVRTA